MCRIFQKNSNKESLNIVRNKSHETVLTVRNSSGEEADDANQLPNHRPRHVKFHVIYCERMNINMIRNRFKLSRRNELSAGSTHKGGVVYMLRTPALHRSGLETSTQSVKLREPALVLKATFGFLLVICLSLFNFLTPG
jgi:hypothetical protein